MKVAREQLQEMYSRYAGERTDGGKDFTLEDHLHQVPLLIKHGVTPQQQADALGVPVEYALALRDYVRQSE